MADRTVTVRLRLDTTAFQQGARTAQAATTQMAGQAEAAGAAAQRSAQQTATAAGGTFSNVSRQAQSSLRDMETAAQTSGRALATSSQNMSRQTTQATAAAARSTEQVAAAAGQVPAAFRAASQSAAGALGQVDAAARGSVQALASVQTGMTEATAAAAAGTDRLSLANRLALAQATTASQAATTASATGFTRISASARAMGTSVATAAEQSEKSLKAARTASLVLVAAFGAAVYAAANFDKAMSGVRAVTDGSSQDMDKLRQAAINAGQATQYSATQAANAEAELAKAGVSTSDILGGGLTGTLSLAAAGQLDLSDAATVAAKAMNAFGLSGKDVSHVADVLAAGAGKSATDVHGLGLALSQSALLAHQTGLSLETTTGALSMFAQSGMEGSDAGTSLKTMLMRLTPQSQQAADLMKQLGFSAYDANGNFVGLSAVAGRMQKSFGNLTPQARNAALGVIFGSDAIRAATILYQGGSAGVDQWTKAVNDQGYASRVAATQTDNLSGDLERLKGSLETALIQSGTAANGVLRDMAQVLTSVVNWYGQLPSGVQQSVTVMAGLVGVVGLVASGLLLALPRIRTVRTELVNLGLTAERTSALMGGLGRLTLVIAALTAISYATSQITRAMVDAPPNVTKLTNALVDLGQRGKVDGEAAAQFGKNLDGVGQAAARIANTSALTKVTDELGKIPLIGGQAGSLTKAKNQFDALDQSLSSLVQSGNAGVAKNAFAQITKQANASGVSTDKLKTLLPQYSDALAGVDTQSKLTAGGQKALGQQIDDTTTAVQDQRTEAQKLTDTLDGLNGVNIDAAEAQISFRQSLADLTKAVKDNGTSLDTTTTKGRAVKSAFLDSAKAALTHAEAVAKQKNSQDAGNKALTEDVTALKAQMKAAGFSTQQIKDLTAAYAKIPPTATTKVSANTDQAMADLKAVQAKVAATKGKSITMSALTKSAESTLTDLGFKVAHMKNGAVKITVPTNPAFDSIGAIQRAIDNVRDSSATVTIHKNWIETVYQKVSAAHPGGQAQANGGIIDYYADGGTRENHVAQIAKGGTWRVWAEDETGGEAYIPLAPSKRSRSRAIADETVRRLGGKGIAWYGTGGVNSFASGGFTYTPTSASDTLGVSTGMDRYTAGVQKLSDAWTKLNSAVTTQQKDTQALRDAESNLSRVRRGHHTATQMAAAETKLRNARTASSKANAAVSSDRKAVYSDDSALGLKKGAKAPTGFNLTAYQKELAAAQSTNATWEKNLAAVGKRAGSDVEDTLRGMGADGQAMVAALAKASSKQFASIVANLKKLAPTAAATLADYTSQLKSANTTSTAFQANLLKLAGMGYGSLATQLAGQGDDAAAAIAAAAVSSSSAAAAANSAAKTNAGLLSSDDITNAVTLLGILRGKPGAGIADVIAGGLDWATIAALAPKIGSQIKAVSGSSLFVQQMAGQGIAMARGGILTQPTTVLAGEAGVPEAYIPLNQSARSRSLLATSAAALGYQLVPAGRYASGGGSGPVGGSAAASRSTTVNLYGAKQSSAEQAMDVARHIAHVG